MPNPKPMEMTGRAPALLGNAVSNAIHHALTRGMEVDEAVCVALQIVVDYGRGTYGPSYVGALSALVIEMGKRPLPQDGGSHA